MSRLDFMEKNLAERNLIEKNKIAVFSCSDEEEKLVNKYGKHLNKVLFTTNEPVSIQNVELADGCRCISINHMSKINAELLFELKKRGVCYISTRSIGYDHIDGTYAKEIGIEVENIAYSKGSVADYTIMLMLMAIRQTKSVLDHMKVQDYTLPEKAGRELRNLTVGVIGTGAIGEAVIMNLKGFGCRIIAYDVCEKEHVRSLAEYTTWDYLLQNSDIITLHVPANEDNYHLINRESLYQMKRDAILINTSRGTLVDTDALKEVLEDEKIGGAALDVVEDEEGIFYKNYKRKILPNRALALLNTFPNVIITPHIAFYTEQAVKDMVMNSLKNCAAFEKKQAAYRK